MIPTHWLRWATHPMCLMCCHSVVLIMRGHHLRRFIDGETSTADESAMLALALNLMPCEPNRNTWSLFGIYVRHVGQMKYIRT